MLSIAKLRLVPKRKMPVQNKAQWYAFTAKFYEVRYIAITVSRDIPSLPYTAAAGKDNLRHLNRGEREHHTHHGVKKRKNLSVVMRGNGFESSYSQTIDNDHSHRQTASWT